MDDYLAAESAIVAQLKDRVANVHILSAAELAGVPQKGQVTPAVHVIYGGDQVPTASADRGYSGKPQKVLQKWLAVIAVRNAGSQVTGEKQREQAGPIISQVIAALAGFEAGKGFGPMMRINAPAPAYNGTFAYFPLQFTTEVYT